MNPRLDPWEFFDDLYFRICQESQRQGLAGDCSTLFRDVWLPLSLQLAQHCAHTASPWIQGILGSQGTGKTTLCAMVVLILQALGYRAASLSLDDLYLNPEVRQAQFSPPDPRHHYRGAPKTHEIDLGIEILQQIKTKHYPIWLPRFDKSAQSGQGRQGTPERIEQIDILLFEGWFVGVEPIAPEHFDHLPEPLNREINPEYARQINADLQAYLPLWAWLDSLIILNPTDYRFSQQWRQDAEAKMKAQGKSGMSPAEIKTFVDYFWQSLHPKLFIPPILTHPKTETVLTIAEDHSICEILHRTPWLA